MAVLKRPGVRIQLNTPWPIILTGVLACAHLIFPSRVWIALLWMVGGLCALGYYWVRELARHISVRRELRFGWVQVGDRLEERFTLVNESWLPVLWAEVMDESDLPRYEVSRVAGCGGHSVVRWTTAVECTRRGVFTLGPWALRVDDPFGFFSVTFRQEERTAIAVYPPVVHLPEIALPRGVASGRDRSRRWVARVIGDVSQTRLYQPKDPLRLVHWPSTAHRGDLIVRERDTEVSGDLWIVLDLDRRVQAGEGEESTEEYGVILAASLADRILRQNRAVGLVAHGAELASVPPGRGRGQVWRILQVLASVRAGGTEPLAQVLRGMGKNRGQGTTLLVITPSCEPGWLEALLPITRWGIAPSVVLLDAGSFERSRATESASVSGMRGQLAQAGISAHVVRQGYPFRHVVPPERRGHWEFKVTPLGRAIVVRRPGGA